MKNLQLCALVALMTGSLAMGANYGYKGTMPQGGSLSGLVGMGVTPIPASGHGLSLGESLKAHPIGLPSHPNQVIRVGTPQNMVPASQVSVQ